MLNTLTNNEVDNFLCLNRHLKLSFQFGSCEVNIVPHKAHFLVTVIGNDGTESYQNWFNDWSDAVNKFNECCRELFLFETDSMINDSNNKKL